MRYGRAKFNILRNGLMLNFEFPKVNKMLFFEQNFIFAIFELT